MGRRSCVGLSVLCGLRWAGAKKHEGGYIIAEADNSRSKIIITAVALTPEVVSPGFSTSGLHPDAIRHDRPHLSLVSSWRVSPRTGSGRLASDPPGLLTPRWTFGQDRQFGLSGLFGWDPLAAWLLGFRLWLPSIWSWHLISWHRPVSSLSVDDLRPRRLRASFSAQSTGSRPSTRTGGIGCPISFSICSTA